MIKYILKIRYSLVTIYKYLLDTPNILKKICWIEKSLSIYYC